MTLVSAMTLGADCIDDCDILRAGRTGQVLGHPVVAPSTLGTFLRAFTFGHVRQLDRVLGQTLQRAWQAGAGPGDGRLVVDVDSFVGEVHGYAKQGAAFGYTRVRGYHPILATRADTGEVLHIRLRQGSANTSRGMLRFCDELIARTDRAGATGPKLLRADSGFWANKTFDRLDSAGWQFSIGARLQAHVRTAIEQIDDACWQTLEDYPATSVAQIAETTPGDRRLVVRRVRTLNKQGELLPSWKHFPFATNQSDALAIVEAEHRQHAVVELAIRDLKDQALAHLPSGKFCANAAWTVIAALAHNLLRWTSVLGLPGHTIRAARTLRRRLLTMPGRLTKTARGSRLTSQPAGPGATPSPKRSPASARYPPPPDDHAHRTALRAPGPRSPLPETRAQSPCDPPPPSATAPAIATPTPIDASTGPTHQISSPRAPSRSDERWIEAY